MQVHGFNPWSGKFHMPWGVAINKYFKVFYNKKNHTGATAEVNRLEMNTVRRNRFNSWELPKIKGYKKKEVQKEKRLDRREYQERNQKMEQINEVKKSRKA